ncbi:MAG: hypothetical protein ABII23_06835 [bacterium]
MITYFKPLQVLLFGEVISSRFPDQWAEYGALVFIVIPVILLFGPLCFLIYTLINLSEKEVVIDPRIADAVEQFATLLPKKEGKKINIGKYIVSHNAEHPQWDKNKIPVTVVFDGELIDALGGFNYHFKGRRVASIEYCVDDDSEALTVVFGSKRNLSQKLVSRTRSAGGVLFRDVADTPNYETARNRLFNDCIALAESYDSINTFWEVPFNGERTIILPKKKGLDKTAVAEKLASSRYCADILGFISCSMPDLGFGPKYTTHMTDTVISLALDGYIETNKQDISPDEIRILRDIQDRKDWNALYERNIDLGIFLPASGKPFLDAHKIGFKTDMRASSAMAVIEEVFTNEVLCKNYFGTKPNTIDVVIGGYGEVGSAVCEALLYKAPPGMPEIRIVGLFNSSGGVYVREGIPKEKLFMLKQETQNGKHINIPEAFRENDRIEVVDKGHTEEILGKKAHLYINSTRYDYLNLERLQKVGARIILDITETEMSPEMRQYCYTQVLLADDVQKSASRILFLNSILAAGVDAYSALEQMLHHYYGEYDERDTVYKVNHFNDEIQMRTALNVYDLFEAFTEHDCKFSISGAVYERIIQLRKQQDRLLKRMERLIPSRLVKRLQEASSCEEIRSAGEELRKFIQGDSRLARPKYQHERNVLENTASYMKAFENVDFELSLMHTSLREARNILLYTDKTSQEYLAKLKKGHPVERAVAARNLANMGAADEQVLETLLFKAVSQDVLDEKDTPGAGDERESDFRVRASCIRAIGIIGRKGFSPEFKERIINTLLSCLTDSSDNVRYWARWAIEVIGFDRVEVQRKIRDLKKEIDRVKGFITLTKSDIKYLDIDKFIRALINKTNVNTLLRRLLGVTSDEELKSVTGEQVVEVFNEVLHMNDFYALAAEDCDVEKMIFYPDIKVLFNLATSGKPLNNRQLVMLNWELLRIIFRDATEKYYPEARGIQERYTALGKLYYHLATVYDYLKQLLHAQRAYHEALSNFRKSDLGHSLIFDTMRRISRIYKQQPDKQEFARRIFLQLIDPVNRGAITGMRKTPDDVTDIDIDHAELASMGSRPDALVDFFLTYQENPRIAEDMGEALEGFFNMIIHGGMSDSDIRKMKDKTKGEKLEYILAILTKVLPEKYNEPYFRLLAIYGTEIYRGKENQRIKNAMHYFLENMKLTKKTGKKSSPEEMRMARYSVEEMRRILNQDKREITRLGLTGDEKEEIIRVFARFKIITSPPFGMPALHDLSSGDLKRSM